MVAIVSGNSLGLGLSSLSTLGQRAQFGSAAFGRSGERAYVNIATGNLMLQRQDDYLAGVGGALSAVRTYNSEGRLDDDNADNWSLGIYNQPLTRSGALNTVGSTLTRTANDGAQSVYQYDASRQLYVTTDGAGAHDTIAWDGANSQYIWTDGDSGVRERYEGGTDAKLLSRTDANGNKTVYAYNPSGQLTSVTSASGETAYYDFTGNNLSQIRVVAQGGATTTRVRYTYTSNRLTGVTVDLSPENNNIADGKTYQTNYTYDSASGQVASVVQSDGTRLDITYVLVDGKYRVATLKDALNQTTTYNYDVASRRTTVTDPLNVASRYSYDAQGQLTQVQTGITASQPYGLAQLYYAYDAQGNVRSITDGLGQAIILQYDANGNLTLKTDALGNTVASTYDSNNQLLTETISGATGSGTATVQTATTRNVYDTAGKRQLRFAISAEGRVTEYRYNSLGQKVCSIEYAAAIYDLSALTTTQSPPETQMQIWAAAQSLQAGLRTDWAYDFRGQLDTRITYGALDAAGNGTQQAITQYIFSQAGDLLKTIELNAGSITQYTYDGLGRVLTRSDASSITSTEYNDALGRTTVTLASGLSTLSSYDAAGRLTSVVQSSAGTALGTTNYTYDQNSRLVKVQDPTGVSQWMVYDDAGRKVADIDGTGAVVEYIYNLNNLLTQTIAYANKLSVPVASPTLAGVRALASAADRKSWRIYDSAQRLVWQVDAQGYVTQTDYDSASRIVAVTQLATPLNTSLLGDASTLLANSSLLSSAGVPTQSATAVAVQASANRVSAGTAITLNARVFGNDPQGTVSFYDGTVLLGTATLVSGSASITLPNLAVGAHSISVRYAGNSTSVASTSIATQVSVQTSASVTLVPPPTSVAQGTNVALTATVTGNTPSGTVSFFDGTTLLGSASIQTIGGVATAVLYVSTLGLGSHSVTASYSGDSANGVASSVASAPLKVAAPSTVTLTSSAASALAGTLVTLTAAVGTGTGQATGSVSFYDGSTLIGTGTLSNGIATLTTSALPLGVRALSAVYAGDDSVAACSSGSLGQVVLPPQATTTVLTPSHVQLATGGALTLSVRVQPVGSSGTLTGNVTFYDGSTVLGTVALANGIASFAVSSVTAGAHSFRAQYAGDSDDATSSSASVAVTAVAGGPNIAAPAGAPTPLALSSSTASLVQSDTLTLTATLSPGATGTVSFVRGGRVLGTATVVNGVATLTVNGLALGNQSIQASYSGDTNYPASVSTQALALTVTAVPTTFSLNSSAASAARNTPVVLTAQLAGGTVALPPTGSVTFYNGATVLGTATLANGIAALSVTTLPAGLNNITVQYAGDSNNAAATSAVFAQTITAQPVSLTLASSASAITAGAPVTLTANVGNTVTGSVTFLNGQVVLGVAPIVNGVASLTTSALSSAGASTITAAYSGDANNAGAVSSSTVITVGNAAGDGSISLGVSHSTIAAGGPLVLTANVGGTANTATSGVSFLNGIVTKTKGPINGAYDWDASIRSTVGYTGGASVSFVPQQNQLQYMIGLNTDPQTNDSYNSLDYAIYCAGSGVMQAYQNGGMVANLGTYNVGDSLSVVYDGTYVKYLKNGVVLRQEAATITQPLYLDSTWKDAGAQVGNLQFKNAADVALPLVTASTGSVSFFNGQTLLGTANVVNGVASLSTSALTTLGTAIITATYSGDANHAGAVSAPSAVTVAERLTLSASSTNVTAGSPVTLTANLAGLSTVQSQGTQWVYSGTAATGNTVTRTSSPAGWNSSVHSATGYTGGASVSFVPQQTNKYFMVGLNTDPATDNTYATIDWGLCATPDGVLKSFNGTFVTIGTYSVGDVLSVEYDGGYIRYLKNGVVLSQTAATITQPLHADSCIYDPGASFSDLQFRSGRSLSAMSGTVTFLNGTTVLGTSKVVNGTANLTTSALTAAGTANITAVYSGDAYNTAGNTNATAINVSGNAAPATPPASPIGLTASSTSINPGGSVTLTANVGAVNTVQSQSSQWVMTGMTASGNTVTKTGGTDGYDGSFRSAVGYTGAASVSFTVLQNTPFYSVGLNTDPATDTSYASIDWAFYLGSSDVLQARQNGQLVASLGTYSAGDVLSVVYDGSYVHYRKNGVTLHLVAANITQPLYADSSFWYPGTAVGNLQFRNSAATEIPSAGTVTFYNGQKVLGTSAVSNGVASLNTSALTSMGTALITAVYNGDSYNSSAASSLAAIAVGSQSASSGTATSLSLSASSTNVTAGSPVTLTANLAGLSTVQSQGSAWALTGVTANGNTITRGTTSPSDWTASTRTHDDVPFADYYQLASLGLLEAIDRYDPGRGVRFRSYASKRIVGSILNGLENQTEKTSQISEQRRLRRERIASIKDTARRRGRDALKESEGDGDSADDTEDLAPLSQADAGMACRPEALFLYLAEVSMGVALGILLEDTGMIDHDAFGSAGHAAGPEVNYFRNDAIRRLQADVQHAIAQLVPVQQSVVRMHYLQSMAFTDIANHLALSRGRISQLHRQALENLQALIRPPPDFDMAA